MPCARLASEVASAVLLVSHASGDSGNLAVRPDVSLGRVGLIAPKTWSYIAPRIPVVHE